MRSKFDGYRLQAHISSNRVRLLTRRGLDSTARFGVTLAGALADLPVEEAIIHGEVVVESAGGAPNYGDGKLIHAGRVGTGLRHRLAEDLFRRL